MESESLPFTHSKSRLTTFLQNFVKNTKTSKSSVQTWELDVRQRLNDFVVGGKLLRGSLVCYAYNLYKPGIPDKVLRSAAGLELLHSGLLIHDDLIDEAKTRRGKASIPAQYRKVLIKKGDDLTICAGDMAFFLGWELLDQPGISELCSRAMVQVCAGQMLDIYTGTSSKLPSKSEIYNLMTAKTAIYSVALPLQLGARLAKAPVEQQEQLYELGLKLGLIFQIRNDEAGTMGGEDIRQAKKTLNYYYLHQAASPAELANLGRIFGNHRASRADISYVHNCLIKYGVQELVQADINRLRRHSVKLIEGLALNDEAKAGLKQTVLIL